MSLPKVFILSVLLTAFGITASPAQDAAAEKKANIDRLLEATGSLKIGQQMSAAVVTQMINVIKQKHPDIPQKVLDGIPEEVNAVIGEHMAELKTPMTALYDKYYTADDIKQLLAFYSSDIGKKVISVTPSLMQESVGVGMKWGQALGPEIQKRLQDRLKKQGVTL